MNRLCRVDLGVGQPLLRHMHDGHGRPSLRAGGGANVFEWLLVTGGTQRQLFDEMIAHPPSPDVVQRIVARATRIRQLCETDADAALASVHLDSRNPYPQGHAVHRAILCALISARLEMPELERRATVCAALTCDVGMLGFPHLEKRKTALDGDEAAAMRRHVSRSAAVLELCGVTDALWTDAVLCHHERWNGSGYPDGLTRREIPLAARVLAVADTYTALVKPRPYREALPPFHALAELMREMGLLYDADVCAALVKEIGMYPPGSFVWLASGETAVVKTRCHGEEWPVYAVYGADDLPYLAPRRRDAATADFDIRAARLQSECRAAESIARRLWA